VPTAAGHPRARPPVPDRRRLPAAAELERVGLAAGLDAVGVAPATAFATTRRHLQRRKAAGLHGGMSFTYRRPERSTDPGQALRNAAALVVGARSYRRAEPDDGASASPAAEAGDPGRPLGRVARYSWEDHYAPLRVALGAVADVLKAEGWRARVLVDDNALVDREAAYRAGLGWYGKNANLLLPGAGSWFVLGGLVTDAPLDVAAGERVADGCGSCTRCLTACPTGAIVAPGVVDARRCLAWLLQVEGPFPAAYRVALGDRLYGCDDCQEVCPPNRRAARVSVPPPAGARAEPTVDLLALLAASDDELLARHGRWYVPRRQARYLRRNALVVLGNVGRGDDPAIAAALATALASDDPLVRGHAVWAARRLGRDDLVRAAVLDDPDPLVRAELAAEVPVRHSGLDAPGSGRDHDGRTAGVIVDVGEG
jgi:epoxyqueuosine reductase